MESQKNTTPCNPSSLPTTGDKYLDQAIDQLPPDAVLACVAFMERGGGQDCMIPLVEKRLHARASWMDDPGAVNDFCVTEDDSALEERITFWQMYRAGWAGMRTSNE